MEKTFVLPDKILQILAANINSCLTFEELSELLTPVFKTSGMDIGDPYLEKLNHAETVDALIFLEQQGYIVLNPDNDQSNVSLKGIIKIKNDGGLNSSLPI